MINNEILQANDNKQVYNLQVIANTISAQHTTAIGTSLLHGIAGIKETFIIQAKDQYNNYFYKLKLLVIISISKKVQ